MLPPRLDVLALLPDAPSCARAACPCRALSTFVRLTSRERSRRSPYDGCAAEEIAEAQFVELTRVRSQIRSVLRKLGVHSQLAAVAYANRVGWTSMHGDSLVA